MADLEEQLRELASSLDFPATPRLGPVVRARIAAGVPRVRLPWGRLALIGAAAVLALSLSLAVFPTWRDTLAGWLHIRGVIVQRTQSLPSPTSQPRTGSLGERLRLGEELDLAAAQARVGFKVRVPAALGPADQVFYVAPPRGGQVSLVYHPGRQGLPQSHEPDVGLLLTEFRGELNPGFFGKMLGPDTTFTEVAVDGSKGVWIAGAPHAFLYNDSAGNVVSEDFRLAGNTLLWERAGVTYRIEGATSKARAVAIANSLQ